jgi:NADP-dependent 3-hydroxy acid dehydrogenase YdfG
MSNSIERKVVVITGASSGLGEAAARFLSTKGARVVLGAHRVGRIQSLADELTGSGGKAFALRTDVTLRQQVQAPGVLKLRVRGGRCTCQRGTML